MVDHDNAIAKWNENTNDDGFPPARTIGGRRKPVRNRREFSCDHYSITPPYSATSASSAPPQGDRSASGNTVCLGFVYFAAVIQA